MERIFSICQLQKWRASRLYIVKPKMLFNSNNTVIGTCIYNTLSIMKMRKNLDQIKIHQKSHSGFLITDQTVCRWHKLYRVRQGNTYTTMQKRIWQKHEQKQAIKRQDVLCCRFCACFYNYALQFEITILNLIIKFLSIFTRPHFKMFQNELYKMKANTFYNKPP